jgi:oligosaccharide repeat unit polymerase
MELRRFNGYNEIRSTYSKWLWAASIVATFILANLMVGPGAAFACASAMFASSILHSKTGSPFRWHRVTIQSFWFLAYLAMIYFPAFFVYSDEPGPFRGPFLFSANSVLITVPLGFIIASRWCNFRESETEAFFSGPIECSTSPSAVQLNFWVLLLFSLILVLVYLKQAGTIPMFYLIRHPGEWLTLALLREESFKLLNSSLKYIFYLQRALLFPFLILVSFGYYLLTRSKRWLGAFCIASVSGLFFASLSIAKAPVAAIFVVLALFIYYYRHGFFNFKLLLGAATLIFAFPVFVIAGISGGDASSAGIFMAIFDRLTYGPSEVVYYYYEVFPAHMAYLHGASNHTLSILFGMQFVDTPNLVGQYAQPGGLASLSYNGAFISDMHADFGLAGVLIGGVLAGIVMQLFHIYVVRKRKTVCSVAAYCVLVYTFWFLNSTSLPVVLASDGAIAALALLWLFDGKCWPTWFSRNIPTSLARVQTDA